jgi:hypothetical protein
MQGDVQLRNILPVDYVGISRECLFIGSCNNNQTDPEIRGSQQKPLAAPYASPCKEVGKGAKTFTIPGGPRQEIISVDRMKAHTCSSLVSPSEAASHGRPPM